MNERRPQFTYGHIHRRQRVARLAILTGCIGLAISVGALLGVIVR